MNAPATPPRLTGPIMSEDALPVIQAKAAEKSNSFKVKVFRKPSITSPTTTWIASLEDATVEHLANPEQWLPMLGGGGPVYVLTVTPADEFVPLITFMPPALPGAPRTVDPDVVKSAAWKGPSIITYPTKEKAPAAAPASALSDVEQLLGAPAHTPVPARETRDAGGGGGPGVSDLQRRLDMEAMARMLVETQKRSDERLAQAIEGIKALVVSQQAQAPKDPPKPLAQQLVELAPVITALGGLILPVITKGKEAEAAREAAREAAIEAARKEANGSRDELMKMLAAASERAAAAQGDVMKTVTPMVEAVSVMGRTMLQQVATMKELAAGEQGPSEWVELGRAAIGAFGEIMAAKASAGAPGAPPQRQLPPGPAPQPGQPAAQEQEQEQQDPAAARAEQREWFRTTPAEEVIARTVEAIQGESDPEELAEDFLDAVEANPGVAQAVQSAGGPLPFFRAKLGDPWLLAHRPYVEKLVFTLTTAAKKRQAPQ